MFGTGVLAISVNTEELVAAAGLLGNGSTVTGLDKSVAFFLGYVGIRAEVLGHLVEHCVEKSALYGIAFRLKVNVEAVKVVVEHEVDIVETHFYHYLMLCLIKSVTGKFA